MERNISDNNSVIEEAQEIAKRIYQDLTKAIFALVLLEQGHQNKLITDSLNNTYEAHSFNMIGDSLTTDAVLSLSRLLEDNGKEIINFSYAIAFLNNEEKQELLCKKNLRMSIDNYKKSFEESRKIINDIKKSYKEPIIEYRNIYLAHSLSKQRISSFQYGSLRNLMNDLIPVAEKLSVLLDGVGIDYKETEKIFIKYADEFWKRLAISKKGNLNWESVVGEAVKRRKEQKLTQEHLAVLAGVSKPTLNSFENGQTSIKLESALKILRILGLE